MLDIPQALELLVGGGILHQSPKAYVKCHCLVWTMVMVSKCPQFMDQMKNRAAYFATNIDGRWMYLDDC